ncbi:PQ-loop-domain-containing protein [Amylostereum chailletii]|nr:PQ-loop-domain-containing protein [Amylostereum chailletii]
MSTTDTLSSVLGWISIATWVYSPQIYENYRLKSGEGLSVPFVIIWLLGDLCNLVGAAMAGLLPTVIILAVYYSICDTVLLFQVYYYRWLSLTHPSVFVPEDEGSIISAGAGEEAPLLERGNGPHASEKTHSARRQILEYAGAIMFIAVTGVAAWAISEQMKADEETTRPGEVIEWRSQLVGWISALLYLGSRLPQIYKNFHTKCEGLAPGLFIFGIMGNTTYAASILVSSTESEHLITNASWLAGSILTIFLDVFCQELKTGQVLGQFVHYRGEGRRGKR